MTPHNANMYMIQMNTDPKHILSQEEYYIQPHNNIANLLILKKKLSEQKRLMLNLWLADNISNAYH